jgi:hypothetical protein
LKRAGNDGKTHPTQDVTMRLPPVGLAITADEQAFFVDGK